MNPAWQTYLQNNHSVIEADCVAHFGDITAELKHAQTETIMVDLSHHGLICFSGDDAQTFLQNQFSCDVRETNLHKAQYGSYCSPKGRILASFLLWQKENTFLMQLPSSLCATIQKRLSMYVLRAKVRITDCSQSWIRIGIAGQGAQRLAEELSAAQLNPDSPLSVAQNGQTSIICHAGNRFELVTPIENAPTLWEQFSQHARPVGAACWDWLEIQSGIPVILPATQEQFLPQMVNLDAIGGVSFRKGCYPGQEIVARTQYLGKLKRRMFLANISTTSPVSAGDELFSADLIDQSSGRIVNAAPAPQGGFDVLAVIQQSSFEAGNIHWQTLDGPVLKIRSLPYSVDISQ